MVRRVSESLKQYLDKEITGYFYKPAWIDDLRSWVERQIEPHGIRLRRDFRQLSATPNSTLIRFETDGPAVWFKAVDPNHSREVSITATLARLHPAYVPTIIARHLPSNGWLSNEAEGPTLEDDRDHADWQHAAACLARMQVQSIAAIRPLIECGMRGPEA